MNRVQGDPEVQLLECTNPVKNKWRIRWDVQKKDELTAFYMEHEFNHKPALDEIQATVTAWINNRTDDKILTGFTYEDAPVWLSTENQFNYQLAYTLAVQTGGKSLPVTFKLGTDEKPVYKTFNTLEALQDFYTKAVRHILDTVAEGWKQKDNFNLNDYITT